MRAIRAAVGPHVALYVDANEAYPREKAAAYVQEMAEQGVLLVEDPCRLQPDRAFHALQTASPVPLLVDQACGTEEEARLFLEQGAQALSLKVAKAGLSESRRIAEQAHAASCAVHVGLFGESSLGALVALQLASALPDRATSLPAEPTFHLLLAEEYVSSPLQVVDGAVRLPDTAGLATWVDWGRVAALRP